MGQAAGFYQLFGGGLDLEVEAGKVVVGDGVEFASTGAAGNAGCGVLAGFERSGDLDALVDAEQVR